ncbi:hypothetical protein FHN55_14710 [Streptomyces sp. NP160]|uniref:hypothetical protein n=1 Tax=Streptomyces sp. NP160 TaxID=2586637 RepID=UPI00111AE09B|nr:hypothetical protein [Streptomyces sp. NP160]TNM64227.1 hypothetical protein FHN55_14710 [Streptomyces sp. NP160]
MRLRPGSARALLRRGPATAAPAWPALGAAVPVALLRVAAGTVAGVLAWVAFPGAWSLAAVVALLVTVWPRPVAVVALVLVVAGVQALRPLAPVQPGFFAALAGVHLLHVLTALARVLPWRARLQLRVLARPLGRFAVVQAGAQAVAGALLVLLPGPGGGLAGAPVPVVGVLGAAVLLVLTLVLLRPLLVRPPR